MKHPLPLSRGAVRAGLVLAFAALAACTNPGPAAPSKEASAKRPNVLVILADDLGYSDLGAYGSEIPTPNLDQLAQQSRLLTSHYVSPTCSPTRAMLLSGSDHHLAGMGSMAELIEGAPGLQGRRGYEGYLHERVLWLPELLQEGGYYTTMAGKWHLGNRNRETWPSERGFETSFALWPGGAHHFAPVPGKPVPADQAPHGENGKRVQLPANFYSSDFYTDKIIANLERNKADGKPFFAYLAYTAPHWPLQAPDADIARFAGRYDAGYEAISAQRLAKQKALGIVPADFKPYTLPASKEFPTWEQLTPEQRRSEAKKMEVYAAMVHNMDRNIGRLLQYLKSTGQYDNTMIVFMSDNGAESSPSFFPNNQNNDNSIANIGRPLSNVGYGPRWAEVSSTPLRYFKGFTAEGGISSPTIVRMPGQATKMATLTAATHVTDWAPTILELAGVRMPSGTLYASRDVVPMTGMSLLPALRQPQAPAELTNRTLSGELFGGRYTRTAQWKLVSVRSPFSDNRWELYDIVRDRGETRNLASERPEIVKQLTSDWESFAKSVGVVMVETQMPHVHFGAEGSGLTRPAQPPQPARPH